MSEHPMATPADPHAYKATVMAVRNLFRRQAVTVEQAWAILLQREGGPEAMPAGAEGRTRELLAEFGYVEHEAAPVGGGESGLLWIRPDWLVETIEEVPLY